MLQDVLLSGSITGVWEFRHGRLHQTDADVNACYRKGWLQAELATTDGDEDYDLEKTVFISPLSSIDGRFSSFPAIILD